MEWTGKGEGMLAFLAAISSGADRGKCERLYLRYRDLMYHVAYRILYDERRAEDAVHRAFLKVIGYLQKIDENNCPKTKSLMVIIIKGVAIDEYNRRKKHGEAPFGEFYDTPVEDAPPDGVTAAILRLPRIYAEALCLPPGFLGQFFGIGRLKKHWGVWKYRGKCFTGKYVNNRRHSPFVGCVPPVPRKRFVIFRKI